jgi:beta-xylosidase
MHCICKRQHDYMQWADKVGTPLRTDCSSINTQRYMQPTGYIYLYSCHKKCSTKSTHACKSDALLHRS